MKSLTPSWWQDIIILACIFSLLFAIGMGSRPLIIPDEGRYAEIPREMVATGDYLTPHLNGIKYFEKPPLFYWMESSTIKAFGLNEWSLRLIPAILGILGCLLLYAGGRKLYDRRTGLLSSFILASNLLYFFYAHFISPDLALSLFLTTSLLSFLLGRAEPSGWRRSSYFLLMYAFAALATMTKGLIGIVFPGLIIFTWVLLLKKWRELRTYHIFLGLLVFLLIAAPWHILVQIQNPEFGRFYFIEQHLLRYFTDYAQRQQPRWFFSVTVLVGFFPWTIFLLLSPFNLASMVPKNRPLLAKNQDGVTESLPFNSLRTEPNTPLFQSMEAIASSSVAIPPLSQKITGYKWSLGRWAVCNAFLRNFWQNRKQHETTIFLLLWVGIILVFFTFSHSQLIPYVLPLIPALTLLTGRYLSLVWEQKAVKSLTLSFQILLALSLIITVGALVFIAYPKVALQPTSHPIAWYLALALLVITMFAANWFYKYKTLKDALLALVLGSSLFFILINLSFGVLDYKSTKPLAMVLKPLLINNAEVANYHNYYQDLPVYLQRRIIVVDSTGEMEFGTRHQDASAWMISTDNFWQRWQKSPRMFVIMSFKFYNKVKNSHTLYPVAQTSRNILATNLPL